MKDKKKRRDILLLSFILAAIVLLLGVNYLLFNRKAERVEVAVDGAVVETLDLSKDADLIIEGYNGGKNHLIIKNGEVYVPEASCPDKVCVRQGKITKTGEMIVCLPNRMIAKIVGGD